MLISKMRKKKKNQTVSRKKKRRNQTATIGNSKAKYIVLYLSVFNLFQNVCDYD